MDAYKSNEKIMQKIKKDQPIMPQSVQSVRVGVQRSQVIWVPIDEIVPNNLNPRKDDSVKSGELQDILKQGWEMPITCYKKGGIYVVLSGHRRLFAARKMKVRELPVFVVDAPKTHQEEVRRIANAQLAQVDWTPLEWGRFVYERWLAWGKPGITSFAKELKLPSRTVESYVRVLEYFPMNEIEFGIINKQFSMSYLYDLALWIKKVSGIHPELIRKMTEEMVRRLMLEKIILKKVSKESLRKKEFLEKVSEGDLKGFFVDREKHLEDLMADYEFNIKERTFHASLVSMGHARKAVKTIIPKNEQEAKKTLEVLRGIEESLKAQYEFLERKFPDVVKKDDIFEW